LDLQRIFSDLFKTNISFLDSDGNADLNFRIGRCDAVEYGYIESCVYPFIIVPQKVPVYDLMKITGHKKVELKVAD
jgi:hypothetical protein